MKIFKLFKNKKPEVIKLRPSIGISMAKHFIRLESLNYPTEYLYHHYGMIASILQANSKSVVEYEVKSITEKTERARDIYCNAWKRLKREERVMQRALGRLHQRADFKEWEIYRC